MSGHGPSRGGGRDEERKLLSSGRGGHRRGGEEDDRRESNPGCLGFFIGWRKRQETNSSRIAAAPPAPSPAPTGPRARDVQELRAPVRELQAPAMKYLPLEVDDLIVSKIASIFDRSSLQLVCERWRSATLSCTNDPLPLILNADFTLSNFFIEGTNILPQRIHRAITQEPHQQTTCLGSMENWAVLGFEPAFGPTNLNPVHHECSLVQPIKGKIIPLPAPTSFTCWGSSGSVQIFDGNGLFRFAQPTQQCQLRLKKAAVYRSTGLLNFKIAAVATQQGQHRLVFCTPRSGCWTVASADFITLGTDLEFLHEKLFVLGTHQTELFIVDFGPHLCLFPTLSHVRRCTAVNPPQVQDTEQHKNLVRCGSNIWLVVRYLTANWDELTGVRIFELDNDTFGWTEKQTLGSTTILISLSSSKCVESREGIESDSVYFLDHFVPQFLPGANDEFSYRCQVYNLRTGAITEQLIGRGLANRSPGFPMWFFPTD